MLVCFDIKFIRRNQKQRKNGGWRGLPSQSDVFLVEPDKLAFLEDVRVHVHVRAISILTELKLLL